MFLWHTSCHFLHTIIYICIERNIFARQKKSVLFEKQNEKIKGGTNVEGMFYRKKVKKKGPGRSPTQSFVTFTKKRKCMNEWHWEKHLILFRVTGSTDPLPINKRYIDKRPHKHNINLALCDLVTCWFTFFLPNTLLPRTGYYFPGFVFLFLSFVLLTYQLCSSSVHAAGLTPPLAIRHVLRGVWRCIKGWAKEADRRALLELLSLRRSWNHLIWFFLEPESRVI